MIVDGPSLAHVRAVARNMRADDVAEFMAVSFARNHAELADALVERYGGNGETYCFSQDDTPIGVGAMVEGRPNVITIMFFATDMFPAIAAPLAKFCKQRLFPRYRALGVHRIECIAIADQPKKRRWIELLDMKHEATFAGYGKNGEAFSQFAWVKQGEMT